MFGFCFRRIDLRHGLARWFHLEGGHYFLCWRRKSSLALQLRHLDRDLILLSFGGFEFRAKF